LRLFAEPKPAQCGIIPAAIRAQTKGLWLLAFGFMISAALGLLIGGVLYLALAHFLPRLTWLAWAVGLLVTLGGASSYFD
jgi:hypothetical protein